MLQDGATVPTPMLPPESIRYFSKEGETAQRTTKVPLPAKFAESIMIPEE